MNWPTIIDCFSTLLRYRRCSHGSLDSSVNHPLALGITAWIMEAKPQCKLYTFPISVPRRIPQRYASTLCLRNLIDDHATHPCTTGDKTEILFMVGLMLLEIFQVMMFGLSTRRFCNSRYFNKHLNDSSLKDSKWVVIFDVIELIVSRNCIWSWQKCENREFISGNILCSGRWWWQPSEKCAPQEFFKWMPGRTE